MDKKQMTAKSAIKLINPSLITFIHYSHLKVLNATAYTTRVQIPSMPNSFQQLAKLAPSKEILRIALLKCVSGSILQMGCNQDGNASIEKMFLLIKTVAA